jgi:hypothetical protein
LTDPGSQTPKRPLFIEPPAHRYSFYGNAQAFKAGSIDVYLWNVRLYCIWQNGNAREIKRLINLLPLLRWSG